LPRKLFPSASSTITFRALSVLNFYGFRKLREEHVELDSVDESKSKWCHFRHPKFQRGRVDLLNQISKNTHKEVAEKTELDALRTEVKDLKSIIKNLKSDMGILASMVGELSKQVGRNSNDPSQQPPTKKQKLSPPAPSAPHTAAVSKGATQAPPIIKPTPFSSTEKVQSREISSVSLNSEDEEFLTSLFADENFEKSFEQLPDEVVSS